MKSRLGLKWLGHRLLLFGTVRQGPTNLSGLDAPDQGADQGSDLAIGPNLVEINLTSLCLFEHDDEEASVTFSYLSAL
jgi:hypothetical protein